MSKHSVKVLVGLAAVVAVLAGSYCGYQWYRYHRYDELIGRAAQQYAMDPRLVSAVVWRESEYDARQVGNAGEVGLMQVTRSAGFEWAAAAGTAGFEPADLFDPGTNLMAGAWYLARAMHRWSAKDDPVPYALAEYNAGRSNAVRWDSLDKGGSGATFCESITYPSTRRYVKDIMRRYRRQP